MLIYCIVITAVLAFICGFITGYFWFPKKPPVLPVQIGVTLSRELPEEYKSFLKYDGSVQKV